MGNNIKVLMGALAAGIVPVFAFAAAMVAGKASTSGSPDDPTRRK